MSIVSEVNEDQRIRTKKGIFHNSIATTNRNNLMLFICEYSL